MIRHEGKAAVKQTCNPNVITPARVFLSMIKYCEHINVQQPELFSIQIIIQRFKTYHFSILSLSLNRNQFVSSKTKAKR